MCPSPRNQGGGAHSLAGEGWRESQFRRLEKSLALCLLCVLICLVQVSLELGEGGKALVSPQTARVERLQRELRAHLLICLVQVPLELGERGKALVSPQTACVKRVQRELRAHLLVQALRFRPVRLTLLSILEKTSLRTF